MMVNNSLTGQILLLVASGTGILGSGYKFILEERHFQEQQLASLRSLVLLNEKMNEKLMIIHQKVEVAHNKSAFLDPTLLGYVFALVLGLTVLGCAYSYFTSASSGSIAGMIKEQSTSLGLSLTDTQTAIVDHVTSSQSGILTQLHNENVALFIKIADLHLDIQKVQESLVTLNSFTAKLCAANHIDTGQTAANVIKAVSNMYL